MRPSRVNFAVFVFSAGLIVGLTLMGVLLRNPATHANLEAPGNYDRTPVAYLGQQYDYQGVAGIVATADVGPEPHDQGRLLYVQAGCAGCHGVYGEGGAVGTELWSEADADDATELAVDLRNPPNGMPVYSVELLSNDQIELILGYLAFAEREAETLGIGPRPRPIVVTTIPQGPMTPSDLGPTTTPPAEPLAISAPPAAIAIDGDIADWEGIDGAELTLESIVDNDAPSVDASVKVAHDDQFIYVLFAVDDDFNWSEIDPHLAGSPAVMWSVDSAAGPHMGGDELSGYPGLGMVDVWFWRLDCPLGAEQGGAVSGPGDGDPGNDELCNFDDEWATDPDTRDDDAGPGAENSLLGVFSHTDPVEDADGTWYFEMRRPLQTGDPQDAQFVVGGTTQLALAYWDPDAGQNGWGPRDHVQSSNRGWIEVVLTG